MLFAISLRSNQLKRIISATQVLTSARLMTICHNNNLTSKRNETMALSPPIQQCTILNLDYSVVESVRLMKSI